MERNLVLNTDSYKFSHFLQYPPGTDGLYHYLESRGGRFDKTVFFGLQYLLKEYLEGDVVSTGDVDEAKEFAELHGVPFNYDGWMKIAKTHWGHLPIKIKAVEEGTVVPTHNILMSVESTDPELYWLPSWLESLFVRLWYPITVATQSWHIKSDILRFLEETSDDPQAEISFKLHDFGARGVSSSESAGIGGMSHLVNFQGSDTVEGVMMANRYYDHKMSAFSIPAAEHSTITSWGRYEESKAFSNMLTQFAKPGKLVAVVSDSFDIYAAIKNLWCDHLLSQVKESGATIVIRPDSGDPTEVVLNCLYILEEKVGMTFNSKGYKVLPSYFRLIQGDGVNQASINKILETMKANRYSASNIAFGMGGALLQQVDRDTQKFAYKCSAISIKGAWRDVFKAPVTDSGKKSRSGKLYLTPEMKTYRLPNQKDAEYPGNLLTPVFENGKILRTTTLEEARKLANEFR